jgi:hypothetical protein
MRDPNVRADLRIKVAQAAAPFVHSKPASSPPSDPALTAKLIDAAGNVAIEPAAVRDPRSWMQSRLSAARRGRRWPAAVAGRPDGHPPRCDFRF